MTADLYGRRHGAAASASAEVPPPVGGVNLQSVIAQIADLFGLEACLFRADGEQVLCLAGEEGSPTPEEFKREVLGSPVVHWYEVPDTGWIRLVVPIFTRRRTWGYVTASYLPADALRSDEAASFRPSSLVDPPAERCYLKAAAGRLLRAVSSHVQSRLVACQQADDLEDLSGKLLQSFEEISLLYRLGQQSHVNRPPQEVLSAACREMRKVLGSHRSLACLAVPPSERDSREPQTHSEGPIFLDRAALERLLDRYKSRRLPFGQPFIDNEANQSAAGDGASYARLLIVPLCYQSEPLGLLAAVSGPKSPEFDSCDAQLLSNVATQMGAHWKNHLLYAELRELLFSLVRALVSAIDAKDPYTHGHSERVALISRRLADSLDLDAAQIEEVYFAGLLHDVGKIGIRESVLLKTADLSEQEWSHMREHPEIGYRILEPIVAMANVAPGVRFHHESYNGRGYPLGLEGEAIPLVARIIAVADSFDAMTTDRPYRPAFGLDVVRQIFTRGRGVQWDSLVVDRLLDLLAENGFWEEFQDLRRNPPSSPVFELAGARFLQK